MLFSVKGIFKVTCKLVSFYSSKYAVLERRSIIEFDTYLIYSLIHNLTFFDSSMCGKYSIIPLRIDYRRFKIGLVHKYTRGMKEIRSLICIYYNAIQISMFIHLGPTFLSPEATHNTGRQQKRSSNNHNIIEG